MLINIPPTQKRRGQTVLNWITGLVSVLIISFFLYYIDAYSVNFPFQDDNTLLEHIYQIRKEQGWQYNLYQFFRPDNDHRIFVPRLISYLNYLATGHLNFKLFILIASFNLVLVTGFIYRLFRQLDLPFYYFLPIPFLIFQPQYHEVSIWALTGLQHITLLLLLSLCLILLQKPTGARIAVAVVLATLATFTHGNGILVFATGCFLLLLEKRYKTLIPWGFFMLAVLAFYLADYTPGSGVRSTITWSLLPAAFVARLGANFSVFPNVAIPASITWGTVICLLVLPAMTGYFFTSFKSRRPVDSFRNVLYSFFCFIFLTSALITVFRASSDLVLENRFKIYAALSSLLLYLFLLNSFPILRKSILVIFTGFAALIFVNAYALNTPEVAHKHSRLVADTYNWRQHQTELNNFSTIDNSLYFLVPAYQQGYWQVPDLIGDFDALLKTTLQQKNFQPYHFETKRYWYEENEHPQFSVETQSLPMGRQHLHDILMVVLYNEAQQRTYLTGTSPKFAGWRRFLTQGVYFHSSARAVLPLKAVLPGEYRLGCLLKKADGQLELMMTQQTVTL
ncbi:hypothetical protein [Larkinella arboricola]|uniref:hypothetical protein n=1 Tax=Larkinella arboricola TaxID=643671 RepID=UPI000DBA1251|nr:hypothetical protein [Larkinella arboricola]